MKKYIVCIFTIMLLTSCADSLSGNDEQERKLFYKTRKGMTTEGVIKILGEPDYINVDSNTNRHMYYYYFTESKGLRSDMPYVLFDSTGRVIFSAYGG